jgi:hypothetical protein
MVLVSRQLFNKSRPNARIIAAKTEKANNTDITDTISPY